MAKKKPARPRPAAGGSRPAPSPSARTVQQQGASRQRTALYIALAVVALLAVIGVAATRGGKKHAAASSTTTASTTGSASAECVSDTLMDHYSNKDNNGIVHTDSAGYTGPLTPRDDPVYTVNPPSGGDHLSVAVRPGDYEGSRVPPDGNLVHSLEHGYVIIWFKPSVSTGDKTTLRSVLQKYARDVLLVERANMDRPVAATAWGHRMLCGGVDKNALSAFVEDNRNQAPEKVPH